MASKGNGQKSEDVRDTGKRSWDDMMAALEGDLAQEGITGATWAWAPEDDLAAAVVAVTEAGAALLLSVTQDRGALSVHLLLDQERRKFYPSSEQELKGLLGHLTRAFGGSK